MTTIVIAVFTSVLAFSQVPLTTSTNTSCCPSYSNISY